VLCTGSRASFGHHCFSSPGATEAVHPRSTLRRLPESRDRPGVCQQNSSGNLTGTRLEVFTCVRMSEALRSSDQFRWQGLLWYALIGLGQCPSQQGLFAEWDGLAVPRGNKTYDSTRNGDVYRGWPRLPALTPLRGL
jgi:hypothetical protein